MRSINRYLRPENQWYVLLAAFVILIFISTALRYRIDLTAEKRFSLNESTKQLLDSIDSTINITVFLTGDLPADYKKLSMATNDLLSEFRDLSHNNIRFHFEKPGENLPDSQRTHFYDSLQRIGVVFEQSSDIASGNEKATQQLIIPSAIIEYGDYRPVAVDLRSSRTVFKNYNVINDEPQEDKEATLNAAEALLEYKFANAIDKLTRKNIPTIAYCLGNGEAGPQNVNDLIQNLRNDYRLAVFDLKQAYPNPEFINTLLIVKPTIPFTDEDKLKLDQYIMHGGKIIWCIDKLYAELDSLMRSQADFVAFDRNLNVDDILFRYGVRINGNLLQDLNCSKIPLVTGFNADGSPRMQRFPWPYYPFLSSPNNNIVSRNLDRVLSIFPSSIDTIKAPGIAKTILLTSDTSSRLISSPAIVSINKIMNDISTENFNSYNEHYVPVAVLLEGKFNSLYTNRLTQNIKDSVSKALNKPFAPTNINPTQQIVMSDADIVTNQVSQTSGPLAMGELPYENYRFANREFFLNCVDYLTSTSGIFESRNKDFTLRLLDKKKVADEKVNWQLINIVSPVVAVILFGFVYQWRRRKCFGT
ncbi:MAG TPA: gliding motility-associated ABC transporter substrate-binding protein GldG [Parafilimonas sp.]|nr:gliding motility-associated ABC transporter substrate-binding protein GldG [Parafilimonas sp.]